MSLPKGNVVTAFPLTLQEAYTCIAPLRPNSPSEIPIIAVPSTSRLGRRRVKVAKRRSGAEENLGAMAPKAGQSQSAVVDCPPSSLGGVKFSQSGLSLNRKSMNTGFAWGKDVFGRSEITDSQALLNSATTSPVGKSILAANRE